MGLGRVDFQRRLPAQDEADPGLTGLRGCPPERGVRRPNESRADGRMTANDITNAGAALTIIGLALMLAGVILSLGGYQ